MVPLWQLTSWEKITRKFFTAVSRLCWSIATTFTYKEKPRLLPGHWHVGVFVCGYLSLVRATCWNHNTLALQTFWHGTFQISRMTPHCHWNRYSFWDGDVLSASSVTTWKYLNWPAFSESCVPRYRDTFLLWSRGEKSISLHNHKSRATCILRNLLFVQWLVGEPY